ncbi:serine hydrolase domain-containing protein [Caulobacter sp. 17J65-9]|uniref:serine hydrolase domain-containing protein n=1 Tax=Caulobacter sp. 17J65-9 TaxID=2709382 RepID=UPI0013C60863|nr:serine hydrolase domain-containing protein [Caulobacter sp. 17J65-9]NEX92998.1 beta-lactamase family protein [Caulobacter sp. 17J65-9]
MTEIHGTCPDRFARVKDAFAANFTEGAELGARFAVAIDGQVVIDLWGGYADRPKTKAFGPDTLTPVFSTTKAVTALMIATLVEQGKLDYEQRVAELWPEFGQAGKDRLTVAQVMSHQAGLPGFARSQDPSIWFDREAVLRELCAQAPMWEPGTASGYHPVTIGYIAGEIFRRADGRSVGQALREDFAVPCGLDLWIGLPESEHARCADMQKPPAAPSLGELDPIKTAAFLDKGSSPGGKGTAEWRKIEIPSANGHATAPALARFMSVIANGGRIDGRQVLSPPTLAHAIKERIFGQDKVLPYKLSWAAGFLRNKAIKIYGPGELSVGHSGWGGSCAFADPETRVSGGYVMNKQSPHLIGDPRAVRLIDAFYAAL